MGWWVSEAWNHHAGPIVLVSHVFWVIFSIVLHELGHGWAAIRQDDDTPIHTGHMTWNPVVHMGLFSLIAFLLLGIAWGAMPVDPSRFRSRHGDAIVAAAGPMVNLILAIVAILGLLAWHVAGSGVSEPFRTNLGIFLRMGAGLNIVLMLFNLVPVPPLDGSRILASFVPSYGRLWHSEQGAVIALVVFLLAFQYVADLMFSLAEAIVGLAEGLVSSGGSP